MIRENYRNSPDFKLGFQLGVCIGILIISCVSLVIITFLW